MEEDRTTYHNIIGWVNYYKKCFSYPLVCAKKNSELNVDVDVEHDEDVHLDKVLTQFIEKCCISISSHDISDHAISEILIVFKRLLTRYMDLYDVVMKMKNMKDSLDEGIQKFVQTPISIFTHLNKSLVHVIETYVEHYVSKDEQFIQDSDKIINFICLIGDAMDRESRYIMGSDSDVIVSKEYTVKLTMFNNALQILEYEKFDEIAFIVNYLPSDLTHADEQMLSNLLKKLIDVMKLQKQASAPFSINLDSQIMASIKKNNEPGVSSAYKAYAPEFLNKVLVGDLKIIGNFLLQLLYINPKHSEYILDAVKYLVYADFCKKSQPHLVIDFHYASIDTMVTLVKNYSMRELLHKCTGIYLHHIVFLKPNAASSSSGTSASVRPALAASGTSASVRPALAASVAPAASVRPASASGTSAAASGRPAAVAPAAASPVAPTASPVAPTTSPVAAASVASAASVAGRDEDSNEISAASSASPATVPKKSRNHRDNRAKK
jgi:hypothetical protein